MEDLLVVCKPVKMTVFGTEEDIPAGVNWSKIYAISSRVIDLSAEIISNIAESGVRQAEDS